MLKGVRGRSGFLGMTITAAAREFRELRRGIAKPPEGPDSLVPVPTLTPTS